MSQGTKVSFEVNPWKDSMIFVDWKKKHECFEDLLYKNNLSKKSYIREPQVVNFNSTHSYRLLKEVDLKNEEEDW